VVWPGHTRASNMIAWMATLRRRGRKTPRGASAHQQGLFGLQERLACCCMTAVHVHEPLGACSLQPVSEEASRPADCLSQSCQVWMVGALAGSNQVAGFVCGHDAIDHGKAALHTHKGLRRKETVQNMVRLLARNVYLFHGLVCMLLPESRRPAANHHMLHTIIKRHQSQTNLPLGGRPIGVPVALGSPPICCPGDNP
jgi:hypothetical protein